jgi:hypothetical protein
MAELQIELHKFYQLLFDKHRRSQNDQKLIRTGKARKIKDTAVKDAIASARRKERLNLVSLENATIE